jgi:prepilin-type N-terminal cleavage/methylation domain-containing protein
MGFSEIPVKKVRGYSIIKKSPSDRGRCPMKLFGVPSERRSKPASAFTLIELVVVIVVLSILSAMVLPRMVSGDAFRLRVGSLLVEQDLRYAADHALSTGNTVRCVFDTAQNRYDFWKQSSPGVWTRLPRPGTGEDFEAVLGTDPYAGLTLTGADVAGQNELFFNSQGLPLDETLAPLSVPATVTLNGTRVIQITPVSGLVKLLD